MKILKTFILSFLPVCLYAQKVELKVQDNFDEIVVEQTQTELKPGWTVFDIKMKDKLVHYLNGAHAMQMTRDNMPQFHIIPGKDDVLADYAIIRLQSKKYYRKLPKSSVRENEYKRIEPADFYIKSDGDNGFICQPLEALARGEYIILNLSQPPIGPLQDLKVYPFMVP